MIFHQILAEGSSTLPGVDTLVTVLSALGGVIFLYLVFNIIMVLINRRRNKNIESVVQKVEEMNKSLAEIKELLKKKK